MDDVKLLCQTGFTMSQGRARWYKRVTAGPNQPAQATHTATQLNTATIKKRTKLRLHIDCWKPELYLLRVHAGTFPIVKVILQIPIPDTKLQLLQERLILHQIQCIKYIKSFLQESKKQKEHKLRLYINIKQINRHVTTHTTEDVMRFTTWNRRQILYIK